MTERRSSLLGAPIAPSKWLTLIAVCLGLGMLMIDTFVVNVALATISRDLKADLSTAEWTISGYVLMVGVLPVAMGRMGDIFGRRKVYLAGLILFIVMSIACGLATTIGQLVLFRILQGVGGATMMPGTLSIITQAFPPRQRGLAIGIWGGVSGLGLIAGPVLGGLLVNGDSWRWIFFVNVPLGVIALVMGVLYVAESRDESAPRVIDWSGLVLLAGSLLLVNFGITRGNENGWTSPIILGCFLGGVALLPLFVMVERRVRAPLVDLSLFRSGTFVMACVAAFLFSAAVFGSQPYTSLFLQNYWGYSPLKGGLAFLPSTVLVASLMPLSGILGQRLGSRMRLVILTGALAVLASWLLMLPLNTGSGYVDGVLPSFVVRGLGIGLFMSSTSLAVMSAVPVNRSGVASGTLTMARQIGTAMGVAVCGAVFLHHIHSDLPSRLADAPPTSVQRATAAAEHFVPVRDAELRPATRQSIVDGFVQIALLSSGLSAIAAGAALFIRNRPTLASAPTGQPVPVIGAVREPLPVGVE